MNISKLETKNVERYLPIYKFCGPGTKVFTLLSRGEKGINKLDEACLIYDIEYMKYDGDNEGLKQAD